MKRNIKNEKIIAKERINILFSKSDEVFPNKQLANRYVTLARKIALKYKIKIPAEHKRKFCKHCYKYLRTGTNARIRTRNNKLVIYCYECKKYTRIPLK